MARFKKSKMKAEPEVPKARVEAQQLLPGIPDDITLDHISPKLPIKALQVLSSVSCAWCKALRTREIHHARFGNHSTEKETFVLIRHYSPLGTYVGAVAVYSVRDNLFYKLPPIPSPNCIECVLSSDRKVYATPENDEGVFVLDLVGQWQWCKDHLSDRIEVRDSSEVYVSIINDWRTEADVRWANSTNQFVAMGTFYAADSLGIGVYDMERKCWTNLYRNSFDSPALFQMFWPIAVVAVEDELLAVVHRLGNNTLGNDTRGRRPRPIKATWQTCLVRSTGFGSKSSTLAWEIVDCSLPFLSEVDGSLPLSNRLASSGKFVMHPIQL